MTKRVILASDNTKKSADLKRYFALFEIEAVNYRELHEPIDFPIESESDMVQNAREKAEAVAPYFPKDAVLGEDAGLFLAAFPERFGVRTKRDFVALGLKGNAEILPYVQQLVTDSSDPHGYLQANMCLLLPDGTRIETEKRGGHTVMPATQTPTVPTLNGILLNEAGKALDTLPLPQQLAETHRGQGVAAVSRAWEQVLGAEGV